MRKKTEAQREKEAKERAALALRKTKKRLGLGEPEPLKGAMPSPLARNRQATRGEAAAYI
jgi:hypothetical protein